MLDILHIISISFIVGFIGDACLQFGSQYLHLGGSSGWGLTEYFKQHGSAESLCIAGGMMAFFIILYYYLIPLPFQYAYLAIYGIILDLIFRETMVFHSLQGYYRYFNYFWSAIWGAIPLMMPLFVYDILTIYMK